MESVAIVSDTGPIVALAKVDQVHLLHTLFDTVLITSSVRNELLAKRSIESKRIERALTQFVQVRDLDEIPAEIVSTTQHLDQGEASSIQLAYCEKRPLLIDERLGRAAAQQLSLAVVGTVGVLIQAKRRGLIESVMPLLHEVRQKGYWLSEQILSTAAKLSNETD